MSSNEWEGKGPDDEPEFYIDLYAIARRISDNPEWLERLPELFEGAGIPDARIVEVLPEEVLTDQPTDPEIAKKKRDLEAYAAGLCAIELQRNVANQASQDSPAPSEQAPALRVVANERKEILQDLRVVLGGLVNKGLRMMVNALQRMRG